MTRKPLQVVVTWIDAHSETSVHADWELTMESIAKIGAQVDLVHDRNTIGWLGYIDADKLVLFHDYDADQEMGNATVLPTGWVTRIKTTSGKVIYRR